MASTCTPKTAKEKVGSSPVLVVDLDGTLVKTNLLLESLLALLKQKPQCLFLLPVWLMKGRANLKQEVARRVLLDASLLPYRSELLDYLRLQRAEGRSIVMATCSDARIANQVAEHLNVFDEIFASDGTSNLCGEVKRNRLVRAYEEKGFDYAGDERRDMTVWSSARKAILINPSSRMKSQVSKITQVDRLFEAPRKSIWNYFSPLRPKHWLKNLLVFVPLFAAHRFYEPLLWGKALVAFLAFGCCASGGYLFNDIFDLAADRHHPKKRLRSFASGDLPLSYGLAMIPLLAVVGGLLGALIGRLFLGALLLYFALTFAYSLRIKKIVLLDVIFLAGLYTLRIMAGSAAVAIWPSPWLLAFSTFFFLSLALVKRYSELVIMRTIEGDTAKARSYELSDAELLAAKGTASGYVAVLVLALYITSGAANVLYGRHQLLWFLCPLLLYWIGRAWLIAHRGQMDDDPVVFAMNDRTSRILILLMLLTATVAS